LKPKQVLCGITRITQCFLTLASLLFLLSLPALATGNGPNGINVGFDFNWNRNGPSGYSAVFVSATGSSLNTCEGGAVTSTTSSCNFAFSYDIGGVAQTPVQSGGNYSTWSSTCDTPVNTAPLTMFNCFNSGPYGQVFMASTTGTLSNFAMPMTCLNPAGGTVQGLTAFIYQVNADGISLPATPLAQVPVDLSSCPTLTSWTSHTFSPSDFAQIPLNFSGVTVTSGNLYAVTVAETLFTMTPASGSSTSATVQSGGSAAYNFTLTPSLSTFGDEVTFSATGQPTGSTVTFSPSTIAAGAQATNVTMTVQTGATTSHLRRSKSFGILAVCVFPITGLCLLKKSKRARCLGMLLLVALGMALAGCGSSIHKTASALYNITVTATSGSTTQSTVVTLDVQ
jgi:hypothetical protein